MMDILSKFYLAVAMFSLDLHSRKTGAFTGPFFGSIDNRTGGVKPIRRGSEHVLKSYAADTKKSS